MAHPLYSGAAVIHVGTFVQQKEFGWPYFEKLARGGAIAAKGNGAVIEAVARGEKAYGVIIEYMAFNAQWKGSPVGFVFPREGVSAITQPVAILKTARNVEAATAFVDWQLSEEAQQQSVAPRLFPDLRRRRAAERLSAGVVAEDHARRSARYARQGRGQQEAVHRAVRRLEPLRLQRDRQARAKPGIQYSSKPAPAAPYGQGRAALGL